MKKTTRTGISVLSIVFLLIGVAVGVSRSQIEEKRRDFQVAIKYADALAISKRTGDSYEDVLVRLKEVGANAIFVRENTVIPESSSDFSNYKAQGKASHYDGYELKRFYQDADNIKLGSIYIEVLEQDVEEDIYNHFINKDINVNKVDIQGKIFLEIQESAHTLSTTGVGFNEEDLAIAADLGYTILPQVKSWTSPSEESIQYMVSELERLPNLGNIYFSDSEVVGLGSPYMEKLLQEKGLGFVEFFSDRQKGFSAIAKASSNDGKNYTVTRFHTLSDGEVNTYTPQRLLERYMLALRERNINTFLFKLPTKEGFRMGEAKLVDSIQSFIMEAENKGYKVSNDGESYNLKPLNYLSVLLIGIGAFGVFVLLWDELGLARIGMILSIIGFIGYALLLRMNFGLGAKMMALFGTICFPTYATLRSVNATGKGMWHAVKSLLMTVCISFGGALIVVGTISNTEFGLGIELFRGVKLSFVAPLILILLIMVYKHHSFTLKEVEEWIKKPITYGTIILLGVLALVMLVYISKSGNSGQEIALEIQIRKFLTNTLGVRPRTKEFLIGYPVLMIITYYGYKKFFWPLLILATMGPISLINTYTHIHTPFMISLIRSVYGVVIGMIIGIISIYIIEQIINIIRTKVTKHTL